MLNASGIEALFEPRAVTLVGASDDPSRIGGLVLSHLIQGFTGPIHPVNPRRATVQGIPAVPSVSALPSGVDLAIVAAPAAAIPQVMAELADSEVRAAVLLTAGIEDRSASAPNGLRVVGPNCAGLISRPSGLSATFAQHRLDGRANSGIAVLSQSGAVGMAISNRLHAAGVGADFVATTGNEADVTVSDVLTYLVERPDVRAAVLFMESLRDVAGLVAAGQRAAELGKPVAVLKVGSSAVGARAAMSHTGAISAPDAVADAVFARARIVRARDLPDLVSFAAGVAGGRTPHGINLAVLTNSGGMGIMMADAAQASGLTLPPTAPEVAAGIARVIPSYGSAHNPIDFTANVINNESLFESLLVAIQMDRRFDAFAICGFNDKNVDRRADAVRRAFADSSKPVILCTSSDHSARRLNLMGLPATPDPSAVPRMIRALLEAHEAALQPAQGISLTRTAARAPGTAMESARARRLLESAGVPVVREATVASKEDAVEMAAFMGYPVALKLTAESATHKTEVGGVLLGINSEEGLRDGVDVLRERVGNPSASLLLQQMVPPGIELLVGATRHVELGITTITVGLGGVMAEILQETRMSVVPVSVEEAKGMIRRISQGRLVSGARGLSDVNVEQVAEVVAAVSGLMEAHENVVELDLNPVIVSGTSVVAVDALAVE